MLTALIYALIAILILAVFLWVIFAVLDAFGLSMPPPIRKLIYIIAVLIAFVILLNALAGFVPLHGRSLL